MDITDLTKEEIEVLVDDMPIEIVRDSVDRSSVIRNRVFSGIRGKALTEKQFHYFFKVNYRDPFVQTVIEGYLSGMKEAVENRRNELIRDGINDNDAFVIAFSESIKSCLWSVYLRYNEISYDQKFLSAVNCYISSVQKCNDLEKTLADQKDIAGTVDSLNVRIKEVEESKETIEREKQLLNDELSKVRSELENARAELSESRSKQSYAEGREIPKKKEYSYSGDYTYLSICKVIRFDEEIWLKRIGDIVENRIREFIPDEEKRYFEYRDRLFYRNGPNTEGCYGVWNWNVTENRNDPTKDYVLTNHNEDCQPISVIILSGVSSFAVLLKCIKEGIQTSLITNRVLFAMPSSGDSYLSVLCDNSELNYLNGIVKLKDTVIRVKKYSIKQEDIIELDANAFFYKYITMPITGVYVSVDNALEIVKKIIIDQVTWNVAKQNKIERKDWQSYRNMVKAIPTNDIYREIMEKCMCDEEEAKRLISELEQNAERLMNGDDISSEILTAIVNNNTELMVKCEALVEEKWRNENQRLIDGAQTRLQLIKNECDKKQKEADDLDLQLSTVKAEISDYQNSIKEKEKLAADVETKIKKKIEDARNNAADFIAEMSFVSPMQAAYNKPKIETTDVIKGSVISEDAEIIEYQSAKELLDIIVFDNLADAGLDDKEINKAFSAFLYSAHIQKIPIILAGPNGMDIVNAYSVSLSGKEADVFDCSVNYSNEALQKLVDNDSKVTAVKNIINSEWITHIADIIKAKSFIVFICPFAEDLIIEPKSLYNYAVPVFTELLVSSASKEITIAGQASSSYNEFDFQGENNDRIKHSIKSRLAKNMRASALLINKLSDLLTGVYSLCSSESSERIIETICGCIPYLYVSQNTDKIMDLLDAYEDIPAEKRKQITDLIGADNE